ncbi:MAG: hypothetical protein A4E68_01930 [Syntrophaceae bacterium PtaB.Bin095]|jgi:hypothetical protein|nr:MAG: hypothetical protein A4E68_01930 [Syntrophaceae bacterium PtaB.Bin095]
MGFEDWIPIFRGGRQTDSAGRVHDGNALIEKAVASFNAAEHEPPVVIGHPVENAPAWGWVEGLKKEGDLLLAKFRQVQPEFADMVRKGLFKKRSAAFYPDGRLRHVGFLGAMPPAVKGLPDIGAFDEGESVTFEFADDSAERTGKMSMEEKMNEFLEKLGGLLKKDPPAAGPAFSEADLEAARKQAAAEAAKAEREKVQAEFAEQQRKDRVAARKAEIDAWCAGMVKEGKMTPAMVTFGVPEFLAAFAEQDGVLEFGEEKTKATLYDRFKAFFAEELPRVAAFGEVATRDKDAGGAGSAGAKVEALIQGKMKADKGLSYVAAFAEVQRENPDLVREYQQEIGG